jgi:hypothetical protein
MRLAVGIGAAACLGACVAVAASAAAQRSPSPPAQTAAADSVARIVASAQAFLATLDEAGKTKAQFPFDSPQRSRWSNLPTGIFPRAGLRLGDLAPAQRAAAMALLATAFSEEGYRKVVGIMRGQPDQGVVDVRQLIDLPFKVRPMASPYRDSCTIATPTYFDAI